MNKLVYLLLFVSFFSCTKKAETTKPSVTNISESVYASGLVKSENQYQVFANANGIIQKVLVEEGSIVKKGTPLLIIANDTYKLNADNAALAAEFSDSKTNGYKLSEFKLSIDQTKLKFYNDSLLFVRQKALWAQNIGSLVELEQRELAFKNAKASYQSSLYKYKELEKQLNFTSEQTKNTLKINKSIANEYIVRSEIDGKVYSLNKKQGEMINTQMALATIGSSNDYSLELQVDEYDIIRIKIGQSIFISLDSYKGEVFEAKVERIFPIMNERTKTFTVEALFTKIPPVLYPNLTVEANIVIQTKQNVLTIPRSFISKGDTVVKVDGTRQKVVLGLRDYQRAEILSGISKEDELLKQD